MSVHSIAQSWFIHSVFLTLLKNITYALGKAPDYGGTSL